MNDEIALILIEQLKENNLIQKQFVRELNDNMNVLKEIREELKNNNIILKGIYNELCLINLEKRSKLEAIKKEM